LVPFKIERSVSRQGYTISLAASRQSLLPALDECRLFDNSHTAALDEDEAPKPVSLLHLRDREIPEWAENPDTHLVAFVPRARLPLQTE